MYLLRRACTCSDEHVLYCKSPRLPSPPNIHAGSYANSHAHSGRALNCLYQAWRTRPAGIWRAGIVHSRKGQNPARRHCERPRLDGLPGRSQPGSRPGCSPRRSEQSAGECDQAAAQEEHQAGPEGVRDPARATEAPSGRTRKGTPLATLRGLRNRLTAGPVVRRGPRQPYP